MTREDVKAGLRAYKHIDGMIARKRAFAADAGTDEEGEAYLREAERLSAAASQIIAALNRLEPMQMNIVWQKYIRGEFWVYIGQKYHYSERQIIRIGEAGLESLAKIMEDYPEAAEFCRSRKRAAL